MKTLSMSSLEDVRKSGTIFLTPKFNSKKIIFGNFWKKFQLNLTTMPLIFWDRFKNLFFVSAMFLIVLNVRLKVDILSDFFPKVWSLIHYIFCQFQINYSGGRLLSLINHYIEPVIISKNTKKTPKNTEINFLVTWLM